MEEYSSQHELHSTLIFGEPNASRDKTSHVWTYTFGGFSGWRSGTRKAPSADALDEEPRLGDEVKREPEAARGRTRAGFSKYGSDS